MSASDPAEATDDAADGGLNPVIATPLIALGCALGVFLIVVIIILVDSKCRKRKLKNNANQNIKTQQQQKQLPQQLIGPPSNSGLWRDIEVGTPKEPALHAFENEAVFDDEVFEYQHSQEYQPIGKSSATGSEPDNTHPLSDMLINRLEEVKAEDEAQARESPLDYGYEGSGNSSVADTYPSLHE